MKRAFLEIPRHVLIALAVMLVSGGLFAASFLLLGGARDAAIATNARLSSEIQQATTSIMRAREDQDYVKANQQKYEELLKSDKLIPHTRRAAVVELQRIAERRGLTSLNYVFTAAASDSLQSAQAQPANAAYRLSVEDVAMKVGAPLDVSVYGFISDINEAFPGAAVVELVTLTRAAVITDQALAAMNSGADSGLVAGEIKISWRTAQAQDQEQPPPGGQR